MSLEHFLNAVKTKGLKESEVISAIQQEYTRLFNEGRRGYALEKISYVIRFTGVKPSADLLDKLTNYFVMAGEKECENVAGFCINGCLIDIFMQSGVALPKDAILSHYRYNLKKNAPFVPCLMKTGVMPLEQDVLDAYKYHLFSKKLLYNSKETVNFHITSVTGIQKHTGVNVPQKLVNDSYSFLLSEGGIDALMLLQEATHTKADLCEKNVQDAYESYMQKIVQSANMPDDYTYRYFGNSMRRLFEITGIRPMASETQVQDLYTTILKPLLKADFGIFSFEGVSRSVEPIANTLLNVCFVTGIKPVDNDSIQKLHIWYVARNEYMNILMLDYLGVEPTHESFYMEFIRYLKNVFV